MAEKVTCECCGYESSSVQTLTSYLPYEGSEKIGTCADYAVMSHQRFNR